MGPLTSINNQDWPQASLIWEIPQLTHLSTQVSLDCTKLTIKTNQSPHRLGRRKKKISKLCTNTFSNETILLGMPIKLANKEAPMTVHAWNLSTQEGETEDPEFQPSLGYIVNLMSA